MDRGLRIEAYDGWTLSVVRIATGSLGSRELDTIGGVAPKRIERATISDSPPDAMLKPVFLAIILTSVVHAQSTYDFNQLNGSDTPPFTQLDMQDGWSEETFRAPRRCGVTATLSHDGTQSLQFQEVGPGYGCDASRINDANWSYPPFSATEATAYFQADIKVGFWGGSFGLAYDTDGSGTIRGSQAGERGVRFNVGMQSNAQLQLVPASGMATRVPITGIATGGNWLRIRVVMDLTAAGGLGSIEVQNLTNGATELTPVPGLQDIPLGLDLAALDATNPVFWDAVWLHFEGATYGLDNIEIGSDAARARAYGASCSGPSGNTPLIGALGAPRVGNLAFAVGYDGAPPSSSAALFVGFAPISLPIGSCQLLVNPVITLPPVTSDPSGSASSGLPLRNDASLIGLRAYTQWVVLEAGGDLLGLAILSDGLRVRVGT